MCCLRSSYSHFPSQQYLSAGAWHSGPPGRNPFSHWPSVGAEAHPRMSARTGTANPLGAHPRSAGTGLKPGVCKAAGKVNREQGWCCIIPGKRWLGCHSSCRSVGKSTRLEFRIQIQPCPVVSQLVTDTLYLLSCSFVQLERFWLRKLLVERLEGKEAQGPSRETAWKRTQSAA